MSQVINIILLFLAGAMLLYLIKRKIKRKVKKTVVVDPEAQKQYVLQKKKLTEEKDLTMEEKIKLSWQFLVEVKNHVLQKFSREEQDQVKKIGMILAENGMEYKHNIELEVKIQSRSKAKSIDKTKGQDSVSR